VIRLIPDGLIISQVHLLRLALTLTLTLTPAAAARLYLLLA
jgi:hypothetical protein